MSRLFRSNTTAIALWVAILTVQGQTLLDLKSQGRNVDFSGAVATKPFRVGTALPAACNVGEAFFKSDAPAGSNLYACTAINTWTVQSGGGGGASLPATTNLVKGNGSGSAVAANPGTDYYKPGMVISSVDLPPNVATTDAQNTYSDPGNEYYGKYDVPCDATTVSSLGLVKKGSTGACVATTTVDTAAPVWGILISGQGTAAGRVRWSGVGPCPVDSGGVTAGHYVIVSDATNQACKDGGATRPAGGTSIVGVATATATFPGSVSVDLRIEQNPAVSGTGSGAGAALVLADNILGTGLVYTSPSVTIPLNKCLRVEYAAHVSNCCTNGQTVTVQFGGQTIASHAVDDGHMTLLYLCSTGSNSQSYIYQTMWNGNLAVAKGAATVTGGAGAFTVNFDKPSGDSSTLDIFTAGALQ
jgi:hypothetical protein